MANRLVALKRIQKVQADMVKLTELRLASAQRSSDELGREKDRLERFVADGTAGGALLTQAILKTTKAVEVRAAAAVSERERHHAQLGSLRRRGGVLDAACGRAMTAARREEEARDLTSILESWVACGGANPTDT